MKFYRLLISLCILTASLSVAGSDENHTRQEELSASVRCMELQAKGVAFIAACAATCAATVTGLYKFLNRGKQALMQSTLSSTNDLIKKSIRSISQLSSWPPIDSAHFPLFPSTHRGAGSGSYGCQIDSERDLYGSALPPELDIPTLASPQSLMPAPSAQPSATLSLAPLSLNDNPNHLALVPVYTRQAVSPFISQGTLSLSHDNLRSLLNLLISNHQLPTRENTIADFSLTGFTSLENVNNRFSQYFENNIQNTTLQQIFQMPFSWQQDQSGYWQLIIYYNGITFKVPVLIDQATFEIYKKDPVKFFEQLKKQPPLAIPTSATPAILPTHSSTSITPITQTSNNNQLLPPPSPIQQNQKQDKALPVDQSPRYYQTSLAYLDSIETRVENLKTSTSQQDVIASLEVIQQNLGIIKLSIRKRLNVAPTTIVKIPARFLDPVIEQLKNTSADFQAFKGPRLRSKNH